MQFFSLIESLLMEAVALTKGSQRVMNDKNLVANLADAIRDDARSHPAAFPAGSSRSFQKAPDEQLAQWFLENIDKIEKAGYEGTIYSRDGVYSDWIVRRYIAGSHNWEDLTGVMNMNIRDWTILKNRNMLDANHRDLPKFSSVRELGRYMALHYEDKLTDVRDAAKNAERNKKAKTIKIVDNDDYKIYITLNRAAACAVGLGTQWCTANSTTDSHYQRYSAEAFLFQVFPKNPEKVDKISGFNQKHITGTEKYQFGADASYSFKDIADDQVDKSIIKTRFPYMFTDISHALKSEKGRIEQSFKELLDDPTLQDKDFKIKTYEIDDEIKKLHKFVDKGYFTDQVRPRSVSSAEAPAGDQPQQIGQEQPQPQPQGQQAMENVDKDVAAMLSSLKKYDILKESVAPVLGMRMIGEENRPDFPDLDKDGDKTETMAKALKDKEAKKEVAESEDENPWKKLASDKKDEEKTSKTHKGGTVTKTEKGLVHKAADKKEDVKESADEEVLAWMGRFAKLGNMKGYGR